MTPYEWGYAAGLRIHDSTKEEKARSEVVYAEEIEASKRLPENGPYSRSSHVEYMNGWIAGIRKNWKFDTVKLI